MAIDYENLHSQLKNFKTIYEGLGPIIDEFRDFADPLENTLEKLKEDEMTEKDVIAGLVFDWDVLRKNLDDLNTTFEKITNSLELGE